jgi:predicted PurR-regulated permease PerM
MKLKTSHYFNLSIVLFSFFALGRLLYPYFTVIILAIITAYYFYPIFKRFRSKFARKEWISLFFTRLVIILVIIVPLIIISTLLLNETGNIIADLSNSKFRETSIASINTVFEKISLSQFQVDSDQTKQMLIDIATKILNSGTSLAVSISNSLISFVTSFILYLFVTSSLITKHKSIIKYCKRLLPVESTTIDIYLHHLSRVGSAMILGTFVIAIIQGILTALSFSVVGIPYFTFFAFIASLLAVIPMIGTSFLAIPA